MSDFRAVTILVWLGSFTKGAAQTVWNTGVMFASGFQQNPRSPAPPGIPFITVLTGLTFAVLWLSVFLPNRLWWLDAARASAGTGLDARARALVRLLLGRRLALVVWHTMSLMLTRRGFLAAPAALAQTKRPPNFIVIYTDDQGIGDLGCYGARDLKTPHLDRLAARGARLTSWYSNSPVCSPSRCALFTGQYPARHGIMNFLTARAAHDVQGLPPGAVTLPGELKRAGYRTALIGKWHLGSAPECRPLKHGFDEHFGFYSGWLDYYSHRYYNLSRTAATEQIFHDLWRNEERVLQDPDYLTEMLTREAKAFIERQPKNQPFFLALTHGAPHYPMIAPRKYLDRFPASMDPDRRLHAAMIAAIDDGVGEILDLLKRRGLDRDTVIFFQADNGATSETRSDSQGRPYRGGSNAPYRGYKGGLFEGGIRMPALLSWPGVVPANSLVDEPGQTIDILPTFLEWAGRPLPPNRDGQSAVDRLTKSAHTPQREFFWEYQGQLAMRRGDWKLMLGPKQGLGEEAAAPKWLSNLKQDPGETKNWLTAEPGLAGEMELKLRAWAKSVLPRPAGN